MMQGVTQLRDLHDIIAAISYFETSLVPSLSQRGINICTFADKLMKFGVVYQITCDAQRAAVLGGYMNDRVSFCAYVSILVVSEEFRGLGLGKRLLIYAEGKAITEGMKSIKLEVRQKNALAIGFYRHMGYAIDSHCGEDSYLMSKSLR